MMLLIVDSVVMDSKKIAHKATESIGEALSAISLQNTAGLTTDDLFGAYIGTKSNDNPSATHLNAVANSQSSNLHRVNAGSRPRSSILNARAISAPSQNYYDINQLLLR